MLESPDLGCGTCIHRHYDSWHNESWCSHEPPPEGLCPRLLVNIYDKCEYFDEGE